MPGRAVEVDKITEIHVTTVTVEQKHLRLRVQTVINNFHHDVEPISSFHSLIENPLKRSKTKQ